MTKVFRIAFLALFLWIPIAVLAADEPVSFSRGEISIASKDGKSHPFTVELALTAAQRELGLMHRTTLGANAGMLFDFGETREVMMWMKNTDLPLDMLFIDSRGEIVHIASRTTPFSENIISSGAPVKYVLEINAGRAEALQISPGDRVALPH